MKGSETSGIGSDNPTLPAGTSVYALQEMTSSEIDDGIIYQILKEFARTDIANPKTGELTLSDTVGNIATNVIGDYVDTTRVYDVGTKGVQPGGLTATLEQTTTVYQVLTAVNEDIVRPLCFYNGSIYEMTDTQIMDTIISPALDRMTNRGLGSYHFSNGAPKDTNGTVLPGTWTSVFSVTDRYKSGVVGTNSPVTFINNTVQPPTGPSVVNYTVNNSNTNETITYTLYRKTDETAPSSPKRPLRYANTAERGKHIVEMTNAEIIKLVARFRNKIIETGRGKYVFQATSPTSGTWGKRGDNISDLLNQMDVGTYTWGFTRTVPKSFIGAYNSAFTGSFTGSYSRAVAVGYGGKFGNFTGYITSWFTGSYTNTFLAPFNSTVIKNFINNTLLSYTATVVGPTALIQSSDYLWVKRAN